LPRPGTQFTCFTGTKVQILAAVMCGAVAAPASVFDLFGASKASKLRSKTCCGACVCEELKEHRGVLPWAVPAASFRQHMPAYVSIRQHTSAYVSIRQQASGYVRIRQDTSGYVRIRQDTSVGTGRAVQDFVSLCTFVLVKQVN
jgi:hypothetical protein